MSTIKTFPQFRYLIALNCELDFEELYNRHGNKREEGVFEEGLFCQKEKTPNIKKTNSFVAAVDIASNDPRATNIYDIKNDKIVYQKRKIF